MQGLVVKSELSEDFLKDEVRSDYLVSAEMKKVWKVELDILKEFDRVCRENNLTYFIDYGTLIGAVRHQGFIPWDDDIDVTMMRDDYEKLKKIGMEAFKNPYFFQNIYTDQMIFGFTKIRDSRTSAIEYLNYDEKLNQGIFIDVFPLDDVPEKPEDTTLIYEIEKELITIITSPKTMLEKMKSNENTTLPYDIIITMLKSDVREVFSQLEEFSLEQYGKTNSIDIVIDRFGSKGRYARKKEWFSDTVLLPFENLLLPAPIGYHEALTQYYGDYMQIPEDKSRHNIKFDTERPYTYYMSDKRNLQ